ncbi:hypothetical protein RND81_07G110200 [Saponaria officinalis]|uniref:Epidermal patterning factor-like protein n=1 Tax=Saponaria officinalis TaxID=3572 RepID=A0AAW1JRG4_SAPOF
MKKSSYMSLIMIFLIIFLVLPCIISSRHLNRTRYYHNPRQGAQPKMMANPRPRPRPRPVPKSKGLGPDTVEIAGSSLPDCSHACGSCTPCRLVMVSFVCAALEEAETCPMAYKCMCNNKSYPVP